MGIAKEQYYEKMQEKQESELADLLGISYSDLSQTDYHVEADASCDGMIYGYIVYFSEDSPRKILRKIKGLDNNNQVWLESSTYDSEHYDYEEEYDAIIANKYFYDSFKQELENVKQLNELKLDNIGLESVLKRQLFITIIGALETFLSETFISLTNENKEYFRNFIETYPKFKERKFELNNIYKEIEKIEIIAKKEMLGLIYHNLGMVKRMFMSTFKIDFPDISKLSKAVNTRHDLVHRNGKTKDDKLVLVQNEEVLELINNTADFVDKISELLNLKVDENASR